MELVIDLRDGGDWSLDLCFAGLRANLGAEKVLDHPWKKKHREWAGVLQGYVEPDWGLERRTLGYFPQDDTRSSRDTPPPVEMVSRVWLDERMESFQYYRQLGLYDRGVPVVVVAGHDRFWNKSPQFVAGLYGDRLQAMLLDNWREEYDALPFRKARIGWSCNFDHYWSRPRQVIPKKYNICFVGYNSHPDRARFIDHVQRNWGYLNNFIMLEREPDRFDNFIPKERLFDVMLRSKICLNLRGAADRGKTLRAYEIPYVGSYMLSQRIEDPGVELDFHPDIHCEYFADEDELDAHIERALSEPVRREVIARQGHLRAVGDLSAEARWGRVLRWLDDASGSSL